MSGRSVNLTTLFLGRLRPPKQVSGLYVALPEELFCKYYFINPIALRKDKIVHNFGLSECNRVKLVTDGQQYTQYNRLSLQPFTKLIKLFNPFALRKAKIVNTIP